MLFVSNKLLVFSKNCEWHGISERSTRKLIKFSKTINRTESEDALYGKLYSFLKTMIPNPLMTSIFRTLF